MRKYAVEFIGTFFLVLVVGLCVTWARRLKPLGFAAIGMTLAVMVYAGGHFSGGHYNPAVTLAVLLRGGMEKRDALPYVAAQATGAVCAAFLAHGLVGNPMSAAVIAEPASAALLRSFGAEALFTFALAFVVLQVATTKKNAGNSYYGVAIGLVVMIAAVAVGPVSGAMLNPAVTLGVGFWHLFSTQQLLLNVGGQLLGAVAAAGVFHMTNKEDLA